jgi:UDP-N-acetylglucosamine 4,6-dehydratase
MDIFDGKTLLVTGGTGSFGHAVVNRFLKTNIKEIRIVSRDEKKQDDMRKQYNNDKLKFYIGDVRDYNSIVDAFKGVDYVFSAAALKQVPSCEFYPLEAMKTNVIGSNNVITACVANHVKNAVFLSTDKAAYPINAMGITKALMEKERYCSFSSASCLATPFFALLVMATLWPAVDPSFRFSWIRLPLESQSPSPILI